MREGGREIQVKKRTTTTTTTNTDTNTNSLICINCRKLNSQTQIQTMALSF